MSEAAVTDFRGASMNRTNAHNDRERGEDEDVFLDANTSPDLAPTQGLWGSARKRKSTADELVTPNVGKRYRLLGRMVHRSTESGRGKKQPAKPSPKATLTVSTDPRPSTWSC